jgi:hypothetical protein
MQFNKKREIQLKDLFFQNAVEQEEENTTKSINKKWETIPSLDF